MNKYEETTIKHVKLPESWRSHEALNQLEAFLQANWEERAAFYQDNSGKTKQQFLSFLHDSVHTNNYIGTIIFKGEQLNIFPKVFRTDIDNNDTDDLNIETLTKNLVLWINYCNKINYPYLSVKTDTSGTNNFKELFISLFCRYLKSAFDRSSFYRYEEQEEVLHTVRGRIDIANYYTRQIPNGRFDSFQCSFSEFQYDNLLNRIIKRVCKILLSDASYERKQILRGFCARMAEVSDVRCVPSDCDRIKLSKMNAHYSILLSMCKIFLLNETPQASMGIRDSFCFLFPAELLFEGFVGGYLASIVGKDKHVKLQESGTKLVDKIVFEGAEFKGAFTLRHDIFVKTKTKVFILDTKYKQLPPFSEQNKDKYISEISQSDLYQMYAYASRQGLNDVYLLYPLFMDEGEQSPVDLLTSSVISGASLRNVITIHVLRIPFVFSFDSETMLDKLKTMLLSVFGA